jgi:hypothetical protein
MAADDLKGEDLLAEASKVFNAPGTSPAPSAETPATPPPPPAPTNPRPEDIEGEEDLFREANRILGE